MDVDLTPIMTSEYPTKARRPVMSALRSERLAALGVDPCRTWREMLCEYLETRAPAAAVPAPSSVNLQLRQARGELRQHDRECS